MPREKKGKNFIKKPIYEGGPKALRQFISQHLSYPEEALKAKVEGTVVLKYSVGHHGKVVDAKIISGLGHGCDEEAIRLVKLLQFKVPKSRGVKVLFHKDIKIHFRLPKKKRAPAGKVEAPSIQYTYTKTEKNKTQEEGGGEGYSYTINY